MDCPWHRAPSSPSQHRGPEQPPSSSLSQVLVSVSAYRTSWFRKGRGDRWQRDRMSPSVILFSVVRLSSCHGKSILLVTL